jgi:hypothetical protein
LNDFQNLIQQPNKWNQAKILREYLNDMVLTAKNKNEFTDDLVKWLDWARKKADWYDPMIKYFDL